MTEFAYEIKIPKERIAILIGAKGETKKHIEEVTKTRISIDSEEGDVQVTGEDALMLYATRDIIKAVGRGFNPDIALLLLKQDYVFEILNLPDFQNPNQFKRIKGRVIGRGGKTREIIELATECFVRIYGKTIGIVGRTEDANIARRAIEMIIKGSPHSTVYKWLEKMRREMKRREIEEDISQYLKEPDST